MKSTNRNARPASKRLVARVRNVLVRDFATMRSLIRSRVLGERQLYWFVCGKRDLDGDQVRDTARFLGLI